MEGGNLFQEGPEISMPSRQAQLLSMVFHELATNAVKHGALSTKEGRVEVIWQAQAASHAQHLRIVWRERGVAIDQDKQKKGRRGFGSDILERSIPEMLQGSFHRTFHPDGIECILEFSVES